MTPPIFHLFGIVFGQSGSNLYLGAAAVCATTGMPFVATTHSAASAANVNALLIAVSSVMAGNDDTLATLSP